MGISGGKQRATVKDVARLAGVSVATVSNVLTGRGKFAPETKERVEAAIRELEFHPDASARHLKQRRTNTLAILIPVLKGESAGHLEDNPFYWEIVCAMEAEAREHGYRVLLAQTTPDDDLSFAAERNVDGLILLGAYEDYPVLERARQFAVPLVLVDSYVPGGVAQVRINDYEGGRTATEHLLSLGHSRIGLITGARREAGVHYERYRGFCDALGKAGVPIRPEWILEGPISWESGKLLAQQLLSLPERPSAVFASADILALSLVTTAQESGLALPADLSVVGFDDLPLARFAVPTLTTIRQDTRRKGIEAIRLIMRAHAGEAVSGEIVHVGLDLVARHSTVMHRSQ